MLFFFFSSRRRHTRCSRDWSFRRVLFRSHYPAYRAVGFVATGMAKGAEDALASIKVLAAMLLFPLTWTGVAAAVWLWRGMEAGGGAVPPAPPPPDAAPVVFRPLPPILGGTPAPRCFRVPR